MNRVCTILCKDVVKQDIQDVVDDGLTGVRACI